MVGEMNPEPMMSYDEYRQEVEAQRTRDRERWTGTRPATTAYSAQTGHLHWIGARKPSSEGDEPCVGTFVPAGAMARTPEEMAAEIKMIAETLTRFYEESWNPFMESLVRTFEAFQVMDEQPKPKPKRGAGLAALRRSVEKRGPGRQWWVR